MLARLAALLLVLPLPALAQDAHRPGLVRGLCQKDGCDEFSVAAADKVRTTAEGTLLRTRVWTFHASAAGRKEGGEENGYVYCSPTRPAIMAEQGGRTTAFYIAPFAVQDTRETVRKNANFHALYFSICHGPEAGAAAVRDLAGTARSLGYQVPLAASRFAQLNRAEDVISPAASPAPLAERRAAPPAERAGAISPERASAPGQVGRAEPVRNAEEVREGSRSWTRQAGEVIEDVGNWAVDLGRTLR